MAEISANPNLVAHMVSCRRTPNYARNSVRHFLAGSDLPLKVFVDGDDDSYLFHDERLETIVSPVMSGPPGRGWAYDRCRLNTIRAVGAVPPDTDLLLLEDDVALAEDWQGSLFSALDYCHERLGSAFVLSLYAATKPGKREGPVAQYHCRDYYGNIAVVISRGVTGAFLETAEKTTIPADMIVKEMLWQKRFPLRQIIPNVAQHVGDVSTTGSRRIIRSSSFVGKLAAEPENKPKKTQRKGKTKQKLGGFSFADEHLAWLKKRLPEGSTILELGSGSGTAHLCERWTVYSVEHDAEFVGRHGSTYIHAPIIDGWYDVSVLEREMPQRYDLLIVDGPPGRIGRRKFLAHLDLFRDDVPILVDDTHRAQEAEIARRLARILQREQQSFPCKDGRKFVVLEP